MKRRLFEDESYNISHLDFGSIRNLKEAVKEFLIKNSHFNLRDLKYVLDTEVEEEYMLYLLENKDSINEVNKNNSKGK